MKIISLVVEYQGGGFAGWQFQPEERTVQGEIESAISCYQESLAKKQGVLLSKKACLMGSGRTDSGVHARAQVASFRWPEELNLEIERLKPALNGILPEGVAVLEAQVRDSGFDARRTPHIKCYRYSLSPGESKVALLRGQTWILPPLDIPEMIRAAKHFQGTHDFSTFRASNCSAASPVRSVLLSEFSRPSKTSLIYCIVGCGFLKQMVRVIVGTLVQVGKGNLAAESIPELIAAKNRRLAGPTAPAHGLCLEWVRYRRP